MAIKRGKVLIVDDNEDVLFSLNMLLKPCVEAIRVITNPERIPEFLKSFQPDVILLDMNFSRDAASGEEGYAWLKRILEYDAEAVVLFITAYVSTEKTVRAIRAGAVDFIPKPWDKQKLVDAVNSAIDLRRDKMLERARRMVAEQKEKAAKPKAEKPQEPKALPTVNFIGASKPIQALKQQINRVAETDANVLVTGENGTGKDVVARELHRLSRRAQQPLVCIDLGCIPENLFESELFGYEKGAFTGAEQAKQGRIEAADGGTLFLDEIGNLSLAMQQKLLTVIEKRQTSRIGATEVKYIDVRIIAATNADLKARVAEGTFRQDLLYRLNTIELKLPRLAERGNDILLLATYFLDQYAEKYQLPPRELSEAERTRLLEHPWHGNVRELQHAMERCVVMGLEFGEMTETDLLTPSSEESSAPTLQTLNLEELERQAILHALSQADGNLSQAASLLGITRYALYRKVNKLGI
ncbi:MAG: sigma-54-dependent Fis family transcriptional regulator [Bacteroidaceae bacterium]|nr:sigma-54-dependent Fis family transcriptional regulator [Bacteroidaceae bacterium]